MDNISLHTFFTAWEKHPVHRAVLGGGATLTQVPRACGTKVPLHLYFLPSKSSLQSLQPARFFSALKTSCLTHSGTHQCLSLGLPYFRGLRFGDKRCHVGRSHILCSIFSCLRAHRSVSIPLHFRTEKSAKESFCHFHGFLFHQAPASHLVISPWNSGLSFEEYHGCPSQYIPYSDIIGRISWVPHPWRDPRSGRTGLWSDGAVWCLCGL